MTKGIKIMNRTKRDIGAAVSKKIPDTAQEEVIKIVSVTFEELRKQLSKGNSIEIRGFGSFKVQKHKSCIGRNPKKPEDVVVIPERNIVKFKSGRLLRENMLKLKQ